MTPFQFGRYVAQWQKQAAGPFSPPQPNVSGLQAGADMAKKLQAPIKPVSTNPVAGGPASMIGKPMPTPPAANMTGKPMPARPAAPPSAAQAPAAAPPDNYAAEQAYRNSAASRWMHQVGGPVPRREFDPSTWAGVSPARQKEIDAEVPGLMQSQFGAKDRNHLIDMLRNYQ